MFEHFFLPHGFLDGSMSHPDDQTLRLFLDVRLDAEQEKRIETHLEQCPDCTERLTQLERSRKDPFLQGLKGVDLKNSDDGNSDDDFELPTEPIPKSIGNYTILGILGSGGMGTVYRAINPHLNRPAAIKVIKASRALRPSSAERFQRELLAIGKLRHPNIVEAFDAGFVPNGRSELPFDAVFDKYNNPLPLVADPFGHNNGTNSVSGIPYLAMELLEGEDLAHYVKRHGPLPVKEACDIIRQAALGLQHAHEAGLVHRDIKPSNLFRTKDGTVKILDLGLARLLDAETIESDSIESSSHAETHEGQILGSPDYMSPEQAAGAKNVDVRSDLYSLGCTFFYLLTGTPPFGKSTHPELADKIEAHSRQELPPIERFRKDVPPAIRILLYRMVAKRHENRPQEATEVAKILERYFQPAWKRYLALAVVPLLFFVALGIYTLVQPKPEPIVLPPERIEVPIEVPVEVRVEVPVETPVEVRVEVPVVKQPDLTFDWKPIQTIITGSSPINSAFFTSDGNGIIEGRSDGDVFLWDVESGKQLYFFEKANSPINTLSISRDKKLVAASCQNGFVIIWNAMSGKLKDGFRFNNDPVMSVCFSLDNSRLFGTSERNARIWRVSDGEMLQTVNLPEGGKITESHFSPDGSVVYCSSWQSFRIFDSITLVEKSSTTFGNDAPLLKFSSALNWIAIYDKTDTLKLIPRSDENGCFEVYHENRGIKTIKSPGSSIVNVAFSSDVRLLATGETNETGSFIRLWNFETGKVEQTLSLETDATLISSLEFSPDGKRLLARAGEKLHVFEQPNIDFTIQKLTPIPVQVPFETKADILPEKSNLEKLGNIYGDWKIEHSLPGSLGDLNSAYFIFDGREIIDAQTPGFVQRWFVNGSRSEQKKTHSPIAAFALSHDRTAFAYACRIKPKTTHLPTQGGWKEAAIQGSGGWCVWIFSTKTGKVLHSITPVSTKRGRITTLAFSLDKKRFFIGGSGAEVWELPVITTGYTVMPDGTRGETNTYHNGNFRVMLRLPENNDTVLAALFSPDGKDILFGNDKSLLYRYSSDDNSERESPKKLDDMISCMKYGNDFKRLYIANETERILVLRWDEDTGVTHREEDDLVSPRQIDRILAIAPCPNDERLLFGGPDTFGIWNLTTKRIETSLPISNGESIIALDYAPSGTLFLGREKESGKIHLWKNQSNKTPTVKKSNIPGQIPLPALDSIKSRTNSSVTGSKRQLPDIYSPPPYRSEQKTAPSPKKPQ